MKVDWWQGGVHIEPESNEERKALYVLTENLNLTYFRKEISSSPTGDTDDHESVVRVNKSSEVVS